jgi:hypothetical protein
VQEIILRILTDTAAFTIAGALLMLALRKFLLSSIEHYFSRLAETLKASMELEKQKETFLISSRNSVYPEIVELVYRLRNDFRGGLQELKEGATRSEEHSFPPSPLGFGEPLYVLTERLYEYRVFVPGEVFEDLHRFKRCLQDATVFLNRLTRLEDIDFDNPNMGEIEKKSWQDFRQRYDESFGKLESLYAEVDGLYPKITEAIRVHMESVLSRKS